MKKTRSLLALLLTLCLCLGLSVGVFADVSYTWDTEQYAEGASIITSLPDKLTGKTVIMHTNDVHGATESYAKVAAVKAELQAAGADVILVDAGDYFQGDPTVNLSQGATAVEFMNAVGYDYVTLGNHEFDWGWDNLVENFKTAKFKIVSNTQYDGKNKLNYTPYDVLSTKSGLKIGFVGITTPETSTKAHPAKIRGVSWAQGKDLYSEISASVSEMAAQKPDLVIAISHLGVDPENSPNGSRDIYANVPGFDFIIDGHSHTVMTSGEGGEPIASTGTKLANIGLIVIDNASKSIDSNCLFSLENYEGSDDDVTAIYTRINEQVEEEYGATFARSNVLLSAERDPGVRTQETAIGDLITNSMIWYVTKDGLDDFTVDADHIVAITNGGGIRADLSKGDLTKRDIATCLPFGNTLAVVYVTGNELLEALEASTFCTPTALGGYPQTSGIQFNINTEVEYDQGEQYPDSTYYAPASISRVTITSINGADFDPEATYAVVTNDFMAAGGDTYYAFKAASAQFDTGIPMDEALMAYITEYLDGVIPASYGESDGEQVQVTEAPSENPENPDENTTDVPETPENPDENTTDVPENPENPPENPDITDAPETPENPDERTETGLTRQDLTIDGSPVTESLEIYNINGENYFKLRDMAMLLRNTQACFSIDYDPGTRIINITTLQPYTPIGGELTSRGDLYNTCTPSNQPVVINGDTTFITAYNIGGYNFFRLRDLGEALNFGVDYSQSTNTMVVTTLVD